MKIALKCWLKDPAALAGYLTATVLDIVNTVLSTLIVLVLPGCFNNDTMIESVIKVGAILVSQLVIQLLTTYLYRTSKFHIMKTLDNLYCDKILTSSYNVFTEFSTAKVNYTMKFVDDVLNIGSNISDIMIYSSTVISVLLALWSQIKYGSLVMIVVYGIAVLMMKRVYRKFHDLDIKRKKIVHHRFQEIEDAVNGFELVRVFNTQKRYEKSFNDDADIIFASQKQKTMTNVGFYGLIKVVEIIGWVIAIAYSIYSISQGVMDAGTAVSTVMLVSKLMEPVGRILNITDKMSSYTALSDDWEAIMNSENEDKSNRKIELSEFKDSIEIDNVSFKYNSSANVLNDINIKINKGDKIGIVGESGGGKSTLFKLLNRFYNPDAGCIKIDGINISEISDESYARRVGCVLQDNIILPGTIRDNITYGKRNALEAEIIAAAKNANLYDFIMSLPNGFDTEVGPRGLMLSGGQKQRIALARIFLVNPDIILMDEATAALDNESEKLVQEAIDKLSGKTIITIAHRLSTVANSDCIYVMSNHGIAEKGNHEELLAKNGIYASMWNKK